MSHFCTKPHNIIIDLVSIKFVNNLKFWYYENCFSLLWWNFELSLWYLSVFFVVNVIIIKVKIAWCIFCLISSLPILRIVVFNFYLGHVSVRRIFSSCHCSSDLGFKIYAFWLSLLSTDNDYVKRKSKKVQDYMV
jgi:hypothetical protein